MRRNHLRIASCAATLLLVACGGGRTGNDTPPGNGGPWEPPPTVAACASPTLGTAVTIAGSPNRLLSPKLARAGTETGLAYVETAATGPWKVKLQRLTAAGAPSGTAVEAGTVPALTVGYPVLAAASDGSVYVVCWGAPAATAWPGFQCATVPAGSGAATPAASVEDAAYPALAYGPGGFMLAYRNSPGFQVQPLGTDGMPKGTAQLVRLSAAAGSGQLVAIVAMPSGYAVATAIATETPMLHRLDAEAKVLGTPIAFAVRGQVAFAAAGESVGAAWIATSHEATASLAGSEGSPTAPVTLSSDAQSYGQVAIAGGGGTFAVTWSAFMGFIGYRAVGADGRAVGSQVQVHGVGWDDNAHALASVADGFLLATTMNPGSDSIDLVHLGCP